MRATNKGKATDQQKLVLRQTETASPPTIHPAAMPAVSAFNLNHGMKITTKESQNISAIAIEASTVRSGTPAAALRGAPGGAD